MPALLLPAALAAMLALLLPLAIHLARRSEARPTDFAALQWLRQKPRPKSRLRFDEWPLLILRLLLLALVVVYLARPVLTNSADMRPVVAALPGVDAGPPAARTRNIWLAPGFPPYDQSQNSCLGTQAYCPSTNPATLIRHLDSELAPGVPLRLIVPETLQGMDAERPRLSRPVTWQIVPGAMTAANPVNVAGPHFSLRGSGPGAAALRAAFGALTAAGQPGVYDVAAADADLPTPPHILVWLTPGPLPQAIHDWINGGGTALVTQQTPAAGGDNIWHDDDGAALVEVSRIGSGRLFRFTRPLTPAAMPALLEGDFPRRLAALFAPPAAEPSRVLARDITPATGISAWPQPARDLRPWLALAIGALLIAERWFATRRNRMVAA